MYKTPGVYVEEISTLPPSVAEVATAIPAFIGYTAKGRKDTVEFEEIATLIEYEARFGRATPTKFIANNDGSLEPLADPVPKSMLWYAINLYFKNGGGRCWVISVGNDASDVEKGRFEKGLETLEILDEPTLIVMPQSVALPLADYNDLNQQALEQCHKLGDRFAVLDVSMGSATKTEDVVKNFRDGGNENLPYGAAYYPYLDTALTHLYDEKTVMVNGPPTDHVEQATRREQTPGGQTAADQAAKTAKTAADAADVAATAAKEAATAATKAADAVSAAQEAKTDAKKWDAACTAGTAAKSAAVDALTAATTAFNNKQNAALRAVQDARQLADAADAAILKAKENNPSEETVTIAVTMAGAAAQAAATAAKETRDAWAADAATSAAASTAAAKAAAGESAPPPADTPPGSLASLATTNTALYNQIKRNLAEQRVRLPPSAAMAGVYARVDRERGVWKAPANVGLMSVIGPAVQISHDDQADLNVDPDSGKSINAIRSFAGRGTLVWGARTLAGNDNEWRYVPVRRLFIMIEESARKASQFAAFEPNDATTWLKVRGMLESYLYGLWEQGALQGAETRAAYYVQVGLGKTMTPQDILEGVMKVEIGIAAVRPAEFIILRFSHKLAEA